MLQFSVVHREVRRGRLTGPEVVLVVRAGWRGDVEIPIVVLGGQEVDGMVLMGDLEKGMIVVHRVVLAEIEIAEIVTVTVIVIAGNRLITDVKYILERVLLGVDCRCNLFTIDPIAAFPTSLFDHFDPINAHAFIHTLTHIIYT